MKEEELVTDLAVNAEKESEHEEVDHLHHKAKHVYLLLVSIFLSLLMVSFIFATFPISDIIVGKSLSNQLDDAVIRLDGFSVFFSDQALGNLQEIYLEQQQYEFSVCMQGEKKGTDYYIDGLYLPEIYEQTFNHVRFASCSEETLIMLHSHPYKRCKASQTDLDTLESAQRRNPELLMLVMCEPARFSVYS